MKKSEMTMFQTAIMVFMLIGVADGRKAEGVHDLSEQVVAVSKVLGAAALRQNQSEPDGRDYTLQLLSLRFGSSAESLAANISYLEQIGTIWRSAIGSCGGVLCFDTAALHTCLDHLLNKTDRLAPAHRVIERLEMLDKTRTAFKLFATELEKYTGSIVRYDEKTIESQNEIHRLLDQIEAEDRERDVLLADWKVMIEQLGLVQQKPSFPLVPTPADDFSEIDVKMVGDIVEFVRRSLDGSVRMPDLAKAISVISASAITSDAEVSWKRDRFRALFNDILKMEDEARGEVEQFHKIKLVRNEEMLRKLRDSLETSSQLIRMKGSFNKLAAWSSAPLVDVRLRNFLQTAPTTDQLNKRFTQIVAYVKYVRENSPGMLTDNHLYDSVRHADLRDYSDNVQDYDISSDLKTDDLRSAVGGVRAEFLKNKDVVSEKQLGEIEDWVRNIKYGDGAQVQNLEKFGKTARKASDMVEMVGRRVKLTKRMPASPYLQLANEMWSFFGNLSVVIDSIADFVESDAVSNQTEEQQLFRTAVLKIVGSLKPVSSISDYRKVLENLWKIKFPQLTRNFDLTVSIDLRRFLDAFNSLAKVEGHHLDVVGAFLTQVGRNWGRPVTKKPAPVNYDLIVLIYTLALVFIFIIIVIVGEVWLHYHNKKFV